MFHVEPIRSHRAEPPRLSGLFLEMFHVEQGSLDRQAPKVVISRDVRGSTWNTSRLRSKSTDFSEDFKPKIPHQRERMG